MTEILRPDICVIGAGSGGLSVAAAAAAFGVPVVLIERGRMGGDCLNYGCVPSKSLLAAGKAREEFRKAGRFGVFGPNPDVDFSKVHDHVHSVIAAIAPNDSKERFEGLGVHVIAGHARFLDANTVAVGDAIQIKARRFVIATGSSPSAPPIPGLEHGKYLTNETIFDLTERPERLIIVGAGPIGLELAQAHRRLGSDVTVLEAQIPLAKEDPECAAVVIARLEREGVKVRSGIRIARVETIDKGVRVILSGAGGEETIEGSHLLVAAGRKPNVDGLGLEAAGIAFDKRGVTVDKGLRTSNSRVYAIGDVAGGLQFTHVANYHAGLVIRNALFRLPVRASNDHIPWVTFTDPELAQIGLKEDEARARHGDIRVLRWPYHDNDRAQAERAAEGHIKIVTTKSGRILGATIVGAHAGEMITTWTLALSRKLNIRDLTSIVIPYPTLSEIGKRAAISYFTTSLTNSWLRSMISLLRRLG